MAPLKPAQIRPRPALPLISLIVPVYNEDAAIPLFLSELDRRLVLPDTRLELVFVNDGSAASTLAQLLAAAASRANVKLVNLSRNFGKEAAMTAGLDHAQGDAVVL